jgi:hypothetical protein
VPLLQIMTSIGGIPTGGGTGNLLVKTAGTSYASAWTSIVNGSVGIVGTALVTGAFGAVGTAQFTGAFNVVGPSIVTGSLVVQTTGGGDLATVRFNASNSRMGLYVAATTGRAFFAHNLTHQAGNTFVIDKTGGWWVLGNPAGDASYVLALSTGTGVAGGVADYSANDWVTIGTTGAVSFAGTTTMAGAVILSSQTAGILQSSATGVVSATTGGLVLLNTLSPNAIASTNDTTSFTSTYKNYLITFENVAPVNNTTSFQMQVATAGLAFIVAASYISMAMVNVSSIITTDTSTTTFLLSGIRATTALQSSTVYGVNGFIRLTNPAGGPFRRPIVGEVGYMGAGSAAATTTLAQAVVNGVFDGSQAPITGVNFLFSAGNIATGVIKIYGSP